MADAEYAVHPRTKLNRHKERARYDYGTIHKIMNTSSIWHVSFLPTDPSVDPFPTALPMLGHMTSFANPDADPESEPLDLYIHGHSAGRLMQLPTTAQNSGYGQEGVPVCVSATHLDGMLLSLTPFNHSCAYRSAVIHGYATTVVSEEEKMFAMHQITNGLIPNRWENSRVPPTKSELLSTGILKVSVVSASAKVNVGGPSDDRADLKNEQLVGSVWTGVVPVYQKLGVPIDGPVNGGKALPAYLADWIEEENKEGEGYANAAAKMEKKKK